MGADGVEQKKPLIAEKAAKPPSAPWKIQQKVPTCLLFNPLAWLLWILDFLIWLITIIGPIRCCASRMKKKNYGTMTSTGLRQTTTANALVATPPGGMKTVHEVMQATFTKFGNNLAFGTREYLGTHQTEGMRFPLQKFGETKWIKYNKLSEQVKDFGAGLRSLGMQPMPKGLQLEESTAAHTIIIYEETCADWMTCCLGAFSQSICVATSYATLGVKSVVEAVNETNARAIVCNIKDVQKVAEACAEECPSLAFIIYTLNKSLEKTVDQPNSAIKAVSVAEVIKLGKKPLKQYTPDEETGAVEAGPDSDKPADYTPPEPEHLAVIMYTSGSTGKPKGVMIKHSNLTASIAAMNDKFRSFGLQEGTEKYLGYLPAAHIMELTAEMAVMSIGTQVMFSCPKTISSKGACRQRPDGTINTEPGYPHPPGGIQECRPSVMVGVPKIWDIMKKGVEEKMGAFSGLKKGLVQIAFTGRNWAVHSGRDSPLFNALVFNKLKEMLGGNMKVVLSGGGPISADVQNFVTIAFRTPLIQGYALTETSCAGAIMMLEDRRSGIVGAPVTSVELKLRDCVDENGDPEILDRSSPPQAYKSTDKFHLSSSFPCLGRGEVMIRGPSVSAGYFKMPDKTAEVFKSDGWFHSGDIGIFLPDGTLQLVDRLKNLVKLKGGEYIAIEAMEKEYGTSAYVDGVNGGIMCYGDGDLDRPIAFVQVNMKELKSWAGGQGIKFGSNEELCGNAEAEKFIVQELAKIAKGSDLGSNEVLSGVVLISGSGSMTELTASSPWTPENGGLTASNKLNRKPVEGVFEERLQQMKDKFNNK